MTASTQLPMYLNQEEACLSVAIGLLSGDQVGKAFVCPKNRKMTDCLEDAATTYRKRQGHDAQYCVCNRATSEALATQRTGVRVFVGKEHWPRDREMYLGRCEP